MMPEAPIIWEDGDTLLTSTEDRAGAMLIAAFASILSIWIIPGVIQMLRQRSR